MTRFIPSAVILAAALAVSPTAFAKPVTAVQHLEIGMHTEVTDRTTMYTKTGVITDHVKVTGKDGKVKTVSEKETPAVGGGYTVSKTVKGFDGVSHTTTSHATAAASHAGGKKA